MLTFAVVAALSVASCQRSEPKGPSARSRMERLEILVSNPPDNMSDSEINEAIIGFFPRMERMPSMRKYEEIHLFAKTALPRAVAIEKRFGEVDHFITHYGTSFAKTNTWNTEAFFGDRYVLTMQVEIRIDYSEKTFEILPDPVFFLNELADVDRDGSAVNGISERLSSEQFDALLRNDWDFESIGIAINHMPVPNFDIYKAMVRSPRYPISLTDPQQRPK